MKALAAVVTWLKKLYSAVPHLPVSLLKPFVPFVSWYVFLRGLFKIIGGLRSISWGLHSSRLPRLFTSLLDVHPAFYIVGGLVAIVAGVLYLKAYPALAQPARRGSGWQQWAQGAALLTLLRVYETVFLSQSLFWLLVQTAVGWYFIFEFGRVMSGQSVIARGSRAKKHSRRR
jgi:hypothetical protein